MVLNVALKCIWCLFASCIAPWHPEKAEAWRRCALFSLIPQSGWLTFVVGCDSTVSPADIRSGQGVCFCFCCSTILMQRSFLFAVCLHFGQSTFCFDGGCEWGSVLSRRSGCHLDPNSKQSEWHASSRKSRCCSTEAVDAHIEGQDQGNVQNV